MLTTILLVVCRRTTSFGDCPFYSKTEVFAPFSGLMTDGLRVWGATETREVSKLKVIGVMVRGDHPFIDLGFGKKPHPLFRWICMALYSRMPCVFMIQYIYMTKILC